MVFPPSLNARAHQESEIWKRLGRGGGREGWEARDDVKTGDNGMSSEPTFSCSSLDFPKPNPGEFFRRKLSPNSALVDSTLHWSVEAGDKKDNPVDKRTPVVCAV